MYQNTHNGPIVTQMEREGVETDRGNENRAIVARNTALERAKEERGEIDIAIRREEKRIAAAQQPERKASRDKIKDPGEVAREYIELAKDPLQDLRLWHDYGDEGWGEIEGYGPLSFDPSHAFPEHHELLPLREEGGGGGKRGVTPPPDAEVWRDEAVEQDNAPSQEKAAQAHREDYAAFDVGQFTADYKTASGKADGATPEPPGEFKAFDVDDLDKSDKAPVQDWQPVDIEALEQAPSPPEPEPEKQAEAKPDKGPDYELER